MAIYNRPPDPYSSLSASLGSSVGRGLSGLLGKISTRREEEAKATRTSEALVQMGVPNEVAKKISYLPEKQQEMFLGKLLGSEALSMGQEPEQQQLSPQSQLFQQLQQRFQQQQQQQQQPQQQLQQQQQEVPQETDMEKIEKHVLSQFDPEVRKGDFDILKETLTPEMIKDLKSFNPNQKKLIKEAVDDAPPSIRRQVNRAFIPSSINKAIKLSPLQQKPTAKKSFGELLATPRPSKADFLKAKQFTQKQSLAERKFQHTKQVAVDKDTKDTYEKITEKYQASIDNDWRLNKLDKLVKEGKDLVGPKTAAMINAASMKGFGFDLTSLMSADSQVFQKISNSFVSGVKAIFGNRVTQQEVALFMKTIPNLYQSDEGKARVIRNMQLFNKAHKLRYNAMQEIIEMNGGERPKNLKSLVEKKIKPQLDVLGNEFQKIIDFGLDAKNKAESKGFSIGSSVGSAIGSSVGGAAGGVLGTMINYVRDSMF